MHMYSALPVVLLAWHVSACVSCVTVFACMCSIWRLGIAVMDCFQLAKTLSANALNEDSVVCYVAGWDRQAMPLAVYGVQLLLNFMWTPTFFKAHKLGLASANRLGMYKGFVWFVDVRPCSIASQCVPCNAPCDLLWPVKANVSALYI